MTKASRTIAIARKEFLHIIHDPRSLIIIFVMPLMQLILFGYALNMEIQNINLAVIDYSRTPQSSHLIEQFEGSEFFSVFHYNGKHSDIENIFLKREAKIILVIDQDFARNFQRQTKTSIQILVDAADPNAATIIKNYCYGIIANFNLEHGGQISQPFDVEPRIWYNPDMKSAYFFVPGLIALILVMISAMLTSLAITREKETGTLEQILVSPIKPIEIIIGKVFPYIIMAFLDGFLILMMGMILFKVPFAGSHFLLILLSTLYIITALSLGLMISATVETQQVAMMMAISATLLPTVMLSGFIFPIRSMPILLQYVSYIVPAKYFLIIARGILIKGNTFFQLGFQTLALTLMSIILLIRTLRKFSLNLEK
ncbi:ABC transporter permease [candidate division KSB1 bacterium]|nr:ABC transporter permease [candidate division KSB1 bacterium]MBL7093515.1 ABC transporter permease [candidate division KSB1 bacterium]